jgi:phosphatidylserine decarboxylase
VEHEVHGHERYAAVLVHDDPQPVVEGAGAGRHAERPESLRLGRLHGACDIAGEPGPGNSIAREPGLCGCRGTDELPFPFHPFRDHDSMPRPPVPDVTPPPLSLRSRATLAALARLPQGALSRGFGRVADLPVPRPLRRAVIGGFARAVGADPAEAERPIGEYRSVNAFFTRRLRPGARTWPGDRHKVASPVDGTVGQLGRIEEGRALQAKGKEYSVAELLGDAEEASPYEGGSFLTLYLSPKDYHRIHTPLPGRVISMRHLPGGLMPVNAPAVASVDRLFCRNERLVCHLETEVGRCAVVAVGAYNVGRITAAFDPDWTTNRRRVRAPDTRRYDPPMRIGREDELMTFHLGSTVVVLWQRRRMELDGRLEPGATVRVGEGVGRWG